MKALALYIWDMPAFEFAGLLLVGVVGLQRWFQRRYVEHIAKMQRQGWRCN